MLPYENWLLSGEPALKKGKKYLFYYSEFHGVMPISGFERGPSSLQSKLYAGLGPYSKYY